MDEGSSEHTLRGSTWVPRMNLRHLQLLVALAELGSISDAARGMATTQPALSKWLKELEEDIGAPLFERHARGLRATAHGEVLLAHARRVLNEMARAQDSLAALDDGSSHRVLLGAAPASVTGVVPDAVAAFLRRYPRARVEVHEGTMRTLMRKLQQGALDIVVGSLDEYEPAARLHSEQLYTEPMKVIARGGHPLARRKRIGWDDLYEYGWVLWPAGTGNRARVDASLAQAGRGPLPCRVESSSLLSNIALLERSDLLGVVSNRLAWHFARRRDVVPLNFALDVGSHIGMCWRDDPLQEASTLQMLQHLRDAAHADHREAADLDSKRTA